MGMRPQVETEYRREQAAELFGDRQSNCSRRSTAAQHRSDGAGQRIRLQLGQIANFTRAGAPPLGSKPELMQRGLQ